MGRDLKDSDFRSLSEQVTQVGVTCLRQVDQRTEYACEPRLSAKFAPEAVAIQKESAVFLNLLLDRSKMLGVEDISQFDMTDELSRSRTSAVSLLERKALPARSRQNRQIQLLRSSFLDSGKRFAAITPTLSRQ